MFWNKGEEEEMKKYVGRIDSTFAVWAWGFMFFILNVLSAVGFAIDPLKATFLAGFGLGILDVALICFFYIACTEAYYEEIVEVRKVRKIDKNRWEIKE
jgi:hypothetical protein